MLGLGLGLGISSQVIGGRSGPFPIAAFHLDFEDVASPLVDEIAGSTITPVTFDATPPNGIDCGDATGSNVSVSALPNIEDTESALLIVSCKINHNNTSLFGYGTAGNVETGLFFDRISTRATSIPYNVDRSEFSVEGVLGDTMTMAVYIDRDNGLLKGWSRINAGATVANPTSPVIGSWSGAAIDANLYVSAPLGEVFDESTYYTAVLYKWTATGTEPSDLVDAIDWIADRAGTADKSLYDFSGIGAKLLGFITFEGGDATVEDVVSGATFDLTSALFDEPNAIKGFFGPAAPTTGTLGTGSSGPGKTFAYVHVAKSVSFAASINFTIGGSQSPGNGTYGFNSDGRTFDYIHDGDLYTPGNTGNLPSDGERTTIGGLISDNSLKAFSIIEGGATQKNTSGLAVTPTLAGFANEAQISVAVAGAHYGFAWFEFDSVPTDFEYQLRNFFDVQWPAGNKTLPWGL